MFLNGKSSSQSHDKSYSRIKVTSGHRTGYYRWEVTWGQIWFGVNLTSADNDTIAKSPARFCHLDAVSWCMHVSHKEGLRPVGLPGPQPHTFSPPQPPRKGTAGKLPAGNGPSSALPSQLHTALGWKKGCWDGLPSDQQTLSILPAPRTALQHPGVL